MDNLSMAPSALPESPAPNSNKIAVLLELCAYLGRAAAEPLGAGQGRLGSDRTGQLEARRRAPGRSTPFSAGMMAQVYHGVREKSSPS